MTQFVSKYALFVIRRFHEAAENVYVVKVNYKKLTHITPGSENSLNAEALNQLDAEIEDNIEKLHENLRREGVGAEYHVFYTLLGSDEFPAKVCRDALRAFFIEGPRVYPTKGSKAQNVKGKGDDEYLLLKTKEGTAKGGITPEMCIMGLREAECIFRSLHFLLMPKGQHSVQDPNKIFSYINENLSGENFEYAEFGDLQNFENFENLGIGGHTREVGAEIDLGTSLEIYRYAKEKIEDKNALEAKKEKLEKQLNKLEQLKTQIYRSPEIQGLEEEVQKLKKRRREHLRGCLLKLEEGVKKFRDALLPEG